MGDVILSNSSVLKYTQIALFNITPSVSVSLRIFQIIFVNDTDSKIAKDKQSSRITGLSHIYVWKKTRDTNLDELLTF